MQYLVLYTSALRDLLSTGAFDHVSRQILKNFTASCCANEDFDSTQLIGVLKKVKASILKINLLRDDKEAIIHSATQEMLENTLVYRFDDCIDLTIFSKEGTVDTFFFKNPDMSPIHLRVQCQLMDDK